MFKNVASQKLIVYVFDSTTNLPKTGDAANLTAYVSKDYGSVTVLGDTSATEMDSTNAKGYYLFDLTQSETNADTLLFSCKSSTANMVALGMPAAVFTVPANFTATSIDSSGRLDIIKVNGTSQTARDLGGQLDATVSSRLAPTVAARTLDVSATGEAGLDFANIGSPTTVVNLSGTTIKTATDVETDTQDIQSRLPAALTANGNIKSSLVEILTTALTETAGQIAAAFKKFFNIATPAATMDHLILVDTATTLTNDPSGVTTLLSRIGAAITITGGKIDVNDKTGFSLGASGLDSTALTAAAKNAIADSLLDRNMATGTDSGTDSTAFRTPRQAFRVLRNKVSIAAGTMTVTKEDDSTSSFTAAVTTAAGNPITTLDPA